MAYDDDQNIRTQTLVHNLQHCPMRIKWLSWFSKEYHKPKKITEIYLLFAAAIWYGSLFLSFEYHFLSLTTLSNEMSNIHVDNISEKLLADL